MLFGTEIGGDVGRAEVMVSQFGNGFLERHTHNELCHVFHGIPTVS